jgi:molecular chaperone DnaJ
VIEKPCDVCDGEGRVEKTSRIKIKIPAGIAHGSRLRSTRNGEAGVRGGDQGDLYIVVHVKEHPIFQREDNNLFCELPISFAAAALGTEVPVPTLEGKASLKVPAGTQSGQSFKLRGKGVAHVNGRDRGDLYARVLVEIPTDLNAEQRQKLEEFAALCGEENTPLHRSFFERAKEFFR